MAQRCPAPGNPRIYPELWVLRHGETTWNVEGRLQGHLDSPLTPIGINQAKAQGRILAPILPQNVDIRVSPSGRAWRTAELALGDFGHPLVADPRLLEIGLGAWQGHLIGEISAAPADPDADPHLWKFNAPGGERLTDMQARLHALLADLKGPTVLVTHGVTSRMLRCIVLGMAPEQLSEVPGGQGIVHHIREGRAKVLSPTGTAGSCT